MNESIVKDMSWIEDWGGYSALIHQLNGNMASENMKVFIQKADATAWTEVPLIPSVSAEGYAYSWANGLRIFYLGNGAPDKLQLKIDY